MGRGFVVPLYNRWPIVKEEYHRAKNSLGECGLVQCEDNIVVVNICRHGRNVCAPKPRVAARNRRGRASSHERAPADML